MRTREVNTTALNGGDECSTSDSSGKELCRYILGKLVEGRGGGRHTHLSVSFFGIYMFWGKDNQH
jgi:hypothetical protein